MAENLRTAVHRVREVMRVEAILARGRPAYDDDGRERIETATCGECGRSWNDARISSLTPTPSGRCPFEYAHMRVTLLFTDLGLPPLKDLLTD